MHDQELVCSYKNQIVEFSVIDSQKSMSVYFGNIICPACEEICDVCPKKDKLTTKTVIFKPSLKHSHYFSKYLNNQHEYCLRKLPFLYSNGERTAKFDQVWNLLIVIISTSFVVFC